MVADGADITPAGQREQVALAALALAGADGMSTDRLADEVYTALGLYEVALACRDRAGSPPVQVPPARQGLRLVG